MRKEKINHKLNKINKINQLTSKFQKYKLVSAKKINHSFPHQTNSFRFTGLSNGYGSSKLQAYPAMIETKWNIPEGISVIRDD